MKPKLELKPEGIGLIASEAALPCQISRIQHEHYGGSVGVDLQTLEDLAGSIDAMASRSNPYSIAKKKALADLLRLAPAHQVEVPK